MIYKSKSSKAFLLLWFLQAKTISMPSGLSYWQNVFQVIPISSPFPSPHSTLHSPTHPQLYFILCGFCDKLKLSLHPLYPLPLSTPCALLHVPGKIHFFVLYGFYDFSISFATSRSTRELYQFASARDLPINFKDDVAMRIRYAALYVHCHSNRDSDINYFNCHMSFTLPEFALNGETWGALATKSSWFSKWVLHYEERNKKTCK